MSTQQQIIARRQVGPITCVRAKGEFSVVVPPHMTGKKLKHWLKRGRARAAEAIKQLYSR